MECYRMECYRMEWYRMEWYRSPGTVMTESQLENLPILLALLVIGMLAAVLRWGELGAYVFSAVWHKLVEGLRAAWAARRCAWTHPLLRLGLLLAAVLLAGWVADIVQRGSLAASMEAMQEARLAPSREERDPRASRLLRQARRAWEDQRCRGPRVILGQTAGPVDAYARIHHQRFLSEWIWKARFPGPALERERELRRAKQERDQEQRALRRAVGP
ncbi:MAG: hypothetical protein JXR96_20630 [Deltaproteobacteria bacterium]|nr:hypothetical protein [Deltaproteobacteria bacterium]